jgi:hypothetical protein
MNSSWANVFSGTGVGLLLGIVVGLSSSPVVGTVVGALAAGLLALLGLKDSRDHPSPIQALRLAAFGFACTLGVIIGLVLRTSDWLSPKLSIQQQEWKAIGFSDDEAKKIVLYRSTGLIMGPFTVPQGSASLGGKTASSLFSGSSATDTCTATDTAQYASTAEHVKALKQAGGSLERLADVIKDMKPDDQKRFLETINRWVCGA